MSSINFDPAAAGPAVPVDDCITVTCVGVSTCSCIAGVYLDFRKYYSLRGNISHIGIKLAFLT